MVKLTEREKEVINALGHPLYTVKYIETYLELSPASVFVNAPLALIQMSVDGYLSAVRAYIKAQGGE